MNNFLQKLGFRHLAPEQTEDLESMAIATVLNNTLNRLSAELDATQMKRVEELLSNEEYTTLDTFLQQSLNTDLSTLLEEESSSYQDELLAAAEAMRSPLDERT